MPAPQTTDLEKLGVPYPMKQPAAAWMVTVALLLSTVWDLHAQSTATNAAVALAVAAASDLKFALDDVAHAFSAKQTNVTVKMTYGASGTFFAQLQNRAPFDLYLSADIDYPRKLVALGLGQGEVFKYAVGQLVVWAPHKSAIDLKKHGAKALLLPTVRKIAIANPKHAPYGRAAVAAMKSMGIYDQVESKLVYGESIAQTAHFLQSGAADIGILARSLALSPSMSKTGTHWKIPAEAHPPLEQGGMVTSWTKQPRAAMAFRDFLVSAEGRTILSGHGFDFPAN